MSVRIMTEVWKLDLSTGEKLVLLALADCANDEGEAWPNMRTIAAKSSRTERSAYMILTKLEVGGFITRISEPGKRNRYLITPCNGFTGEGISPLKESAPTPENKSTTPEKTSTAYIDEPSKNHQEPSRPQSSARTLPANWWPKDFDPKTATAKVVSGWPPGELEYQVEQFSAHHRSKGTRSKDWDDSWSYWALNSRRFNNGNQLPRSSYPAARSGGGVAAALDRRLGLGGSPGEAGRRDAGEGPGHRAGPFALPGPGR